jgi:phage repressor protein C with HTH and peptisase S24 domain
LNGVEGGYAVYVYGDSMEPRYYAGELLMVHPHKPIARGDFCVMQIGFGDDACGYVKQFVSHDSARFKLRQLNPDGPLEFAANGVTAIHKIVGSRVV